MLIQKKIVIIGFLFLVFCIASLCGQEPHFAHYTASNGLPSSQVHDIVQDNYGNIWFSTDGGLSCYDGYGFKNYTMQNGLTDNSLFKFYKEKNGDIWCTTHSKTIFCISGRNPVFKPYKYNKLISGLPDYQVTNCILWLKDSSLLMGLINGDPGYVHIDKKGRMIKHIAKRTDSLEVLFLPYNEGFYWIGSGKDPERKMDAPKDYIRSALPNNFVCPRPCYFSKKKYTVFAAADKLQIYRPDIKDTLNITTPFEPISLGKLRDSLLWVGFRYGGAGIFDLSGKRIASYLPGKSVTSFYVDHQEGFWISTLNDGVFHAANTSVLYYEESHRTGWVSSLSKDASGNLWIGYYNGDVSLRKGKKFICNYLSSQKRPAIVECHPATQSVFFSSDYKIFAGAGKRSFNCRSFYTNNFYVHNNDTLLIAGNGAIAIANGGIQKEILTGFRVNDVCYHLGTIFMAGKRGLYVMEGERPLLVRDGIAGHVKVTDLDAWNQTLVLGTDDSGVLLREGGREQVIDVKKGLSNNHVNEVHIENDSTLWVCTNTGLNRVRFKKHVMYDIAVISTWNGLLSNEITDVEIIRDTAWIGTRQGLCSYPLSLLKNKKRKTHYYLSLNCFKVNDSAWALDIPTRLAYDQNRIEFGYKAISFTQSEPIVYRHKLEGYEKAWNYTQALSSTYASLPPGTYNFIVQVKGTNTGWEITQQSFPFIISPPYWKTWWFLLIAIVSVAVIVYLFFRFNILSYNRDITRELLRQVLKRIRRKTNYVIFREQGKDIRISTTAIHYVKADGNYIEIHTDEKKYVIRYKIGEFLGMVPDPLEYVRISRSYIVRLDKIEEKSKKDVTVKGEKMSVGETYLAQLKNIQF